MEIQSVSCQIQYILMETDSSRREEQKLEIAFRLLIDTEGWVWGSLEGSPGGTRVGVAHWGVALGLG